MVLTWKVFSQRYLSERCNLIASCILILTHLAPLTAKWVQVALTKYKVSLLFLYTTTNFFILVLFGIFKMTFGLHYTEGGGGGGGEVLRLCFNIRHKNNIFTCHMQ
jgi:hypothetical protein